MTTLHQTLAEWRGVCDAADPGPWCVAWHAQRTPIAKGESTSGDTDGKPFGLYANAMVPAKVDEDFDLCVLARTALPAAIEVIEGLVKAMEGVIAYADDPRIVAQLEDAITAAAAAIGATPNGT